eukprot:EC125219.1.p1 GENE.EC125219.1~~EC125219.1.p1  ORF type:complete len:135 (+),score=36.06 EC125219.1:58-462(+)
MTYTLYTYPGDNVAFKALISLWFCLYKYNEENTKLYMTCNLVGGWLQRVEKLRKYGFGSVVITGEEPALKISGVWLFRSQNIPAEMTDSDDCANYEWRKLNSDDPADQKLVEDYFAWDGESFATDRFRDGKVFK